MQKTQRFNSPIYYYKWLATQLLSITLLLIFSITFTNSLAIEMSKANEDKETQSIKTVSVPIYQKISNKEFDDIIEDLLIAIGEHNFRLNQHARIGKAIADREKIPFPATTVLHFCNLSYAKQLLEIAPDYLLRMPCRVSVRQKEDKTVLIEVWLLPEDDKRTKKFAKKINTILKEIVSYGAN